MKPKLLTRNKLWRACSCYDESLPETSSGMHVVATTNSLFETTDVSCLLISGYLTVSLIDPCENCAFFVIKTDEIGISLAFLSW